MSVFLVCHALVVLRADRGGGLASSVASVSLWQAFQWPAAAASVKLIHGADRIGVEFGLRLPLSVKMDYLIPAAPPA